MTQPPKPMIENVVPITVAAPTALSPIDSAYNLKAISVPQPLLLPERIASLQDAAGNGGQVPTASLISSRPGLNQ